VEGKAKPTMVNKKPRARNRTLERAIAFRDVAIEGLQEVCGSVVCGGGI